MHARFLKRCTLGTRPIDTDGKDDARFRFPSEKRARRGGVDPGDEGATRAITQGCRFSEAKRGLAKATAKRDFDRPSEIMLPSASPYLHLREREKPLSRRAYPRVIARGDYVLIIRIVSPSVSIRLSRDRVLPSEDSSGTERSLRRLECEIQAVVVNPLATGDEFSSF